MPFLTSCNTYNAKYIIEISNSNFNYSHMIVPRGRDSWTRQRFQWQSETWFHPYRRKRELESLSRNSPISWFLESRERIFASLSLRLGSTYGRGRAISRIQQGWHAPPLTGDSSEGTCPISFAHTYQTRILRFTRALHHRPVMLPSINTDFTPEFRVSARKSADASSRAWHHRRDMRGVSELCTLYFYLSQKCLKIYIHRLKYNDKDICYWEASEKETHL